jgi:hypothetical protein
MAAPLGASLEVAPVPPYSIFCLAGVFFKNARVFKVLYLSQAFLSGLVGWQERFF